jgi:mannosyltransferase OCH1-like enzyme
VYCHKPINACISPDFWADPSIQLVVGIEIDEPLATKAVQRKWHWSRNHGFTQWTVIAKPFAEPLKLAIVRSISHAYALARSRGVSHPENLRSGRGLFDFFYGSYTVKDILEVTGPGMWTDAVLDFMNSDVQNPIVDRVNHGHGWRAMVSWVTFTGLQSPRLVGEVLVLPINYFGSGQRHSGSGDFQLPEACVNHLARRSWR